VGNDTARIASEQETHLVIVGRGRIQRVFGTLRTHTYEIIRQVSCPVLSYCATQEEAEMSEEQKRDSEPVLSPS
jgi:hypothetical protein